MFTYLYIIEQFITFSFNYFTHISRITINNYTITIIIIYTLPV